MSDYLPVLPDEFVAETILWRLPVKSIVQCRCVCKSWYSLITSPNFISTHLLRSKTIAPQNPQKVIGQCNMTDKNGRYLLHFDKEEYFRSMLVHVPHIPCNPITQIIGAVKGLICFCVAQGSANRVIKFILFNPSIGKYQSIPPPSMRTWEVKGFGFDERTQDYNILLIMPDIAYFIYSLNSKSWRRIATPNTPDTWKVMPCNAVVFANGQFHWLACRTIFDTVFIRVFDLKTETFGQILLPECLSSNAMFCFTEFGESSVAVIERPLNNRTGGRGNRCESNIWVMKEYGSVESWIKLATIRLRDGEVVLGFRNEDEVFVQLKRKIGCTIGLQKINRDEQAKELIHVDNIAGLDICVQTHDPSLVLLDKKNKVNVDVAAPTQTIVAPFALTPCRKRSRKSVAHENPAAQNARRSQRIKHQPAKFTDFI